MPTVRPGPHTKANHHAHALVSPFARFVMDVRYVVFDLARAGGPRTESPERARLRHDDRYPVRQDQWVRAQTGYHGAKGEKGGAARSDGDSWRGLARG